MNRRRPTADRPRQDRGNRFRAGLEGLETRSLLNAGGLDPSFSKGGEYVVPDPKAATETSGFENFYAIHVQSDGKIDAAGMVGAFPWASYGVLQLNPDGTPDASFGDDGEADLTLPPGDQAADKLSTEILLPDGKIFLAGTVENNGTRESIEGLVDADGTPDPSFGPGGTRQIYGPLGLALNFGALQADGKIVLVGTAPVSPGSSTSEIVVARLNQDGTFDSTFGNGGLELISDAPADDVAAGRAVAESSYGVAIQPDGKILVLGQITLPNGTETPFQLAELIRLNPDGSRDNTLSESGLRAAGMDSATLNGVIAEADGQIVVAGGSAMGQADPMLVRLNADGSLAEKAGVTSPYPYPYNQYVINQVVEQADGTFILTGDEFQPEFITFHLDHNFQPITTFGIDGEARNVIRGAVAFTAAEVLTQTTDGNIVLAGTSTSSTNTVIAKVLENPNTAPAPEPSVEIPGNYTGTGKADVALYEPNQGAYLIRSSSGAADLTIPFGLPGAGQTIPAPGDYDGSGRTELAAYLPAYGQFVYRPAAGGADVAVPFGIAGPGQTLPAPGDYDGDGATDIAAYLPSIGAFAIRPSDGKADEIIPFGIAGAGQSIPAPGDYDGSGRTELAVYLPSLGEFVYRPADGGADVVVPFGIAGAGQSIPAPGDYDGSGKTEFAVYLPALGEFVYRPANGGPDVTVPLGLAGSGQSIPVTGDYEGSGTDDFAVYEPATGTLAIRASDGSVLSAPMGAAPGQSVPVSVVPASSIPPIPPVVVIPVVPTPSPTPTPAKGTKPGHAKVTAATKPAAHPSETTHSTSAPSKTHKG